ncbi:MAG: phospho-2-dehydro-3-deoxyheptonate aldolase, partial [Frankiales bacterium]|nr:phospho-2-dehydro-3-deoxyheptonate aldolase [Frankiales bacterium]
MTVDLDTWRALSAQQQPEWPDPLAVTAVREALSVLPPLVFAAECDALKDRLAAAARGEAFVLQGG